MDKARAEQVMAIAFMGPLKFGEVLVPSDNKVGKLLERENPLNSIRATLR